MRVLELYLRNYRVFENVDLELPARVIGIFGENGSGKSSLMEAIAFALYGVDAARTKKNQIRTHGILTDCEARMVFEHGGSQYEVRRAIKGKGHAPDAALFAGGLLLASGATEVDGEVQRLLHMDLRVFKASAYAEQKQLDAFSDVTAGKRKEMVLRLLGIRPVDDARAEAKKQARAMSQSAEQLVGAVPDLAELEASLKEAKDVAKEAWERAKAATARSKEATVRARSARTAFEASDDVRQRIEKIAVERKAAMDEHARLATQRAALADRLERLTRELEELPVLEEELASLEGVDGLLRAAERLAEQAGKSADLQARLEALPEVDAGAALEEVAAADREAKASRSAAVEAGARRDHQAELLAAAEERLGRAAEADPTQPCPTCGRELGDDFVTYVKHCKVEVAAAKKILAAAEKAVRAKEDAAKRAEERLGKAGAVSEKARRAADERGRLAEQLDALRAEVEAIREPFGGQEPDVEALRFGVGREKELAKLMAALGQARAQLADTERDVSAVDARLAEVAERAGRLDEDAAGLAFDPVAHGRMHAERIEADDALELARGGEQAAGQELHAARQAVSGLEGELKQARETTAKVEELRSEARYLERVSLLLDGFRDHLVSRVGPDLSREAEAVFGELTNHEYDDLRIRDEDLRIEIADGDAYFPIERFSGSETDLANLALRVAISTHLSRMSGADVGMMVLDEVLGSLDAERKDLLVRAMGWLAGRFHQLFVITHAEQVKDQFPASIEVRAVGRRRSVATLV